MRVIAVLALLGLFAASLPGQPLGMVGWQFHERNVVKVAEAMERAPDYGVNFVVFSHELFRHVDEYLQSPERQAEIAALARTAKKKGLDYWLWVHELDDIPAQFRSGKAAGGRVEFDDPALFVYLKQRYERLLDLNPGARGLILTFHESGARIFQNRTVSSRLSVPERIVKLTSLIDGVVRARKQKLMIRNFFYEPKEILWFEEALKSLPKDLLLMRKDTCHEFNPFYPADPLHGQSGREELIELDLGVEKALGWGGHYAQVEHIRQFVTRARERKMAGVLGRARLIWDRPFEDSHEINLFAYGALARDPSLSTAEVWQQWAARRYPEAARPFVIKALARTEWMMHHARYVQGLWMTKWIGEQWHNYAYYFGHPLLRANSKWSHSPADQEAERLIYTPTPEFYRKAVAEKDEVLAQIRLSLADVEAAARYLPPESTRALREGFLWMEDAASLAREWTRAYFAQRIYVLRGEEDWAAIAEHALQRLERMDRYAGVQYGWNAATGHRYNIDVFVADMRRRMANREGARDEDRRVLESVRAQLDVEAN